MRKNIVWNTMGSIFYCACQWLITVIVVRVGTYQDAGYLSLAMSTSSSFSAISLFSMRSFQVSDVKREYSSDIYVGSRILTSFFAFFSCVFVSIWGNSFYQILCIMAFMLVRISEALVDVMHGIDQKYNHYDYIGKSYICRGIVTVVLFSVIQLLIKDVFIALLCVAIINWLIAFFYDWRKAYHLEHFIPVIRTRKLIELLIKCTPIMLFNFILSLETLLPKNILQQKYGVEALGIYSTIASPALVVQVFASVVFNPFLPAIAQIYVNKDFIKYRKIIHNIYLLLVVLGVGVTAIAMLLGKWGLKLLLGENILQYYELFMPIIWCTFLMAIIWIISAILTAMRKLKLLLAGIIGDFIICSFTMDYFIGQYGKNGVSFVQLFVITIYIIYMVVVLEMVIRYQIRKEGKKTYV